MFLPPPWLEEVNCEVLTTADPPEAVFWRRLNTHTVTVTVRRTTMTSTTQTIKMRRDPASIPAPEAAGVDDSVKQNMGNLLGMFGGQCRTPMCYKEIHK